MIGNPMRLRRSQLAVPGSSEKMLIKAAASEADHVFCDLEDAVAPSAKAAARETIADALNNLDWAKKPDAYGSMILARNGAMKI